MRHVFADSLMSVVLFLTAFLLYSSYPVMGADIHSGCYRLTTAKPSPRTCDSDSKNCKVPVEVSADHKPGMSLCFQGIDATYEVYPVNATSYVVNTMMYNWCRPLRPSQSVTSINDACFDGVAASAKDAISASGIHQNGVYTMCSTASKNTNICSIPPLGDEQSCTGGLHTLIGNFYAPTADCPKGVEVGSYYCPELTTYRIYYMQHKAFVYTFEMKKTELPNTAPGITSLVLSTEASVDPYNPYFGWTLITNGTNDGVLHYYARRVPVELGNCRDYCAMERDTITGIFHKQRQCYTISLDLCNPTPQVTWQEFNPIRDRIIVALPHTTEEGTIHKDASYTATKIVKPFTYTANIEIDAARVDPEITSGCAAITVDDVGIQAKPYPQLPLLYIRRVCDQVVLSLYDCVLQYSHHDDSAMYWTVNKADNVPQCTLYVVDNTSALEVVIPKKDHAHDQSQSHEHDHEQSQSHEHDHDQSQSHEHDHDQSQSHEHDHDQSQSHEHDHDQSHEHGHDHQPDSVSKKKLPTWAIVVIVVILIIVIATVVIAVLCMRLRTPLALDEENFDTKLPTLKPPQE